MHNGAVGVGVGVDVPWPGTALLGRDHEVVNLADLMRAGDVRLVTITGPGGVGKTRLALEVARRLGAELVHGAVFVDLSGVADARTVAATIAGRLELGQSGTDEPEVVLRRALSRRQLLLVLDNFEQLLAAAPVPVALVESCPELCVLVTSRAPLRVRAERVFRLAALPVPIRASSSDVVAARQFASVELFCERAGAIRPDFQLCDDNVTEIAGICRALDGLPLAIELAAARISHLTPAVLLERLMTPQSSAPLDALGRGASDLPERQRTMRATIAWSYDLLSPLEQSLLRRLSIFDGDCSLEAIEAVCSGPDPGGGVGLDTATVLDAIAALVDLHLVEPDDHAPDEARFGMLVAIREFGREQLAEAAELPTLRSRHARYYATLVGHAATALQSPDARAWARRLERELVEIRAALRHLAAADVVGGLRMVIGAGRFWLNHGHVAEGRHWLAEHLSRVPLDLIPVPERAGALMWTARLAMDDLPSADPSALSTSLTQLDQALTLARSIHDEQLELEALLFQTHVGAPSDDELEHTLTLAEHGIARARLVNRWRLAELSLTSALLAHRAGHGERAAVLAADACALADDLGNERLSIEARLTMSFTVPGTSLAASAPVLADVLPRADALGDKRVLAWLYPAVGSESLAAGRLVDAARWFCASLALARDAGYWHAGAMGMMGTQALAYLGGRSDTTARLYGVLRPHLPTVRRSVPPASVRAWERLIAAVRTALGDDAFELAARAGAAMTWDDAVEEAITICQGETEEPDEAPSRGSGPHRAWDLELTDRELDVLRHIAAGGTNKDVAAALGITPKTVMHHSVAIYRKLGVRGRAEATAYAYRSNLIEDPGPT
jgi:predicted ATPase/DNA-binding CsgD family transcriptional regulator